MFGKLVVLAAVALALFSQSKFDCVVFMEPNVGSLLSTCGGMHLVGPIASEEDDSHSKCKSAHVVATVPRFVHRAPTSRIEHATFFRTATFHFLNFSCESAFQVLDHKTAEYDQCVKGDPLPLQQAFAMSFAHKTDGVHFYAGADCPDLK